MLFQLHIFISTKEKFFPGKKECFSDRNGLQASLDFIFAGFLFMKKHKRQRKHKLWCLMDFLTQHTTKTAKEIQRDAFRYLSYQTTSPTEKAHMWF